MYKKKSLIGMLGWYGVVATVGAYIFVSFSLIAPTSWLYQILNFTGALGITVETYYKKDYQPFWLNLIWMVIAFVAILSIVFRKSP